MLSQCQYISMSDEGFKIKVHEETKVLDVDNVIICAGQEINDTLSAQLNFPAENIHVIGGAKNAKGLDAKRAIKEAAYLVAEL